MTRGLRVLDDFEALLSNIIVDELAVCDKLLPSTWMELRAKKINNQDMLEVAEQATEVNRFLVRFAWILPRS